MATEMENAYVASSDLVQRLQDSIISIDHVAIAVVDLANAVRWYTERLGFQCVERRTTHGNHSGMKSAVLVAGNAVVVLLEGTTPQSQISRFIEKFGAGVQHVAFCVSDLTVALERVLAEGGHAATAVIEDDGIRQIFLHRDGLSGVRLELIERKGGNFSDRTVDRLFREFESKDLY
jgi:methylmalonyl-CoA/ethylmalonyl-CoA epimerase